MEKSKFGAIKAGQITVSQKLEANRHQYSNFGLPSDNILI